MRWLTPTHHIHVCVCVWACGCMRVRVLVIHLIRHLQFLLKDLFMDSICVQRLHFRSSECVYTEKKFGTAKEYAIRICIF